MKEYSKIFSIFFYTMIKFILLLGLAIILTILCILKKIKEIIMKHKENKNNYQEIYKDITTNKETNNNEIINDKNINNEDKIPSSKVFKDIINKPVTESHTSIINETFQNYNLKILKWKIKNTDHNIRVLLFLDIENSNKNEYINFIINFYDKKKHIIYSYNEEYSTNEIDEEAIELNIDKENIINDIKNIKIYVAEGK